MPSTGVFKLTLSLAIFSLRTGVSLGISKFRSMNKMVEMLEVMMISRGPHLPI
jgi:hypothetical protein